MWYVNEPVPPEAGLPRVVTFQADGHELELILIAMGMQFHYNGTLTSNERHKTEAGDSRKV